MQQCPRCGTDLPAASGRGGRRRRWCSDACRRAAYNERQGAARAGMAVAVVEHPRAPEHTPQSMAEDPRAAEQFLYALAAKVNIDGLEPKVWKAFDRLIRAKHEHDEQGWKPKWAGGPYLMDDRIRKRGISRSEAITERRREMRKLNNAYWPKTDEELEFDLKDKTALAESRRRVREDYARNVAAAQAAEEAQEERAEAAAEQAWSEDVARELEERTMREIAETRRELGLDRFDEPPPEWIAEQIDELNEFTVPPAVPPAGMNRAERRRWERQQRKQGR